MLLTATYIAFYLSVAAACILEDFGRARDIRGMTRTQSVIRPAASAICGLATFVTTKILAGLTALALGATIGINGIVIDISLDLLLLLGYIFSIIAVIYVQSCWVGRWIVPSDPDDSPDTGTSPQPPGIPPVDRNQPVAVNGSPKATVGGSIPWPTLQPSPAHTVKLASATGIASAAAARSLSIYGARHNAERNTKSDRQKTA